MSDLSAYCVFTLSQSMISNCYSTTAAVAVTVFDLYVWLSAGYLDDDDDDDTNFFLLLTTYPSTSSSSSSSKIILLLRCGTFERFRVLQLRQIFGLPQVCLLAWLAFPVCFMMRFSFRTMMFLYLFFITIDVERVVMKM